MITSSRERGLEAKQEGDANKIEKNNKLFKAAAAASASSSRQWSAFRNPRIVRVSRSFGGKDRHSKVCTIRGLRDRRIRLSVPTAIQLYDLQNRLGLSQPSKVIDWLLDATKHDIDNLPPLQLPQGFGQFHPQMLVNNSHDSSFSLSPFFDANLSCKDVGGFHHHGSEDDNTIARSKFNWEEVAEAEASLRGTNQVGISINNNKGKLIKTNDQENQEDGLSAQRLFPLASTSHSSLPSLLNNNNPLQFNPYNYHWDASNLSLSQFGFLPQPENYSLSLNTNNTSNVSLPTSLALSSAGGSSQFFFCPPVTMPTLFPQYPPFAAAAAAAATPLENNESREINHFQLLTSGFAHSQRNNIGRQSDKDHHHADS